MMNTQTLDVPLNVLVTAPFDASTDFAELNHHFEDRSLDDLLCWGLDVFGDKMAQVTSFGPTGMIVLDHLAKLSPGIRIVTLDTDFLFEETYALWDEIQQRYPIQLDVRSPYLTPEAQAQIYEDKLWQKNPDWCCYLRKVSPLHEVLRELDAWLTGLRRDQSPTRADIPLVDWDTKYGLVKINPLAGWTRKDVWSYIVKHNVPYNRLHDHGYASIGCTHCTRPTLDPSNERSGRWNGRQKTECGIHVS